MTGTPDKRRGSGADPFIARSPFDGRFYRISVDAESRRIWVAGADTLEGVYAAEPVVVFDTGARGGVWAPELHFRQRKFEPGVGLPPAPETLIYFAAGQLRDGAIRLLAWGLAARADRALRGARCTPLTRIADRVAAVVEPVCGVTPRNAVVLSGTGPQRPHRYAGHVLDRTGVDPAEVERRAAGMPPGQPAVLGGFQIDGTRVHSPEFGDFFVWSGTIDDGTPDQHLLIAPLGDDGRHIVGEPRVLHRSSADASAYAGRPFDIVDGQVRFFAPEDERGVFVNEAPQQLERAPEGVAIGLLYNSGGTWNESYCIRYAFCPEGVHPMDVERWQWQVEPVLHGRGGPGHAKDVVDENGVHVLVHHRLDVLPDGSLGGHSSRHIRHALLEQVGQRVVARSYEPTQAQEITHALVARAAHRPTGYARWHQALARARGSRHGSDAAAAGQPPASPPNSWPVL